MNGTKQLVVLIAILLTSSIAMASGMLYNNRPVPNDAITTTAKGTMVTFSSDNIVMNTNYMNKNNGSRESAAISVRPGAITSVTFDLSYVGQIGYNDAIAAYNAWNKVKNPAGAIVFSQTEVKIPSAYFVGAYPSSSSICNDVGCSPCHFIIKYEMSSTVYNAEVVPVLSQYFSITYNNNGLIQLKLK